MGGGVRPGPVGPAGGEHGVERAGQVRQEVQCGAVRCGAGGPVRCSALLQGGALVGHAHLQLWLQDPGGGGGLVVYYKCTALCTILRFLLI